MTSTAIRRVWLLLARCDMNGIDLMSRERRRRTRVWNCIASFRLTVTRRPIAGRAERAIASLESGEKWRHYRPSLMSGRWRSLHDQAVEECGKWWPETNTGRKQKLALDSVIYHLPSARVIHNKLLNIGSKIRSLEFAVNGAFRKIFSVKSYDVVSDWVKYFNCSVSKSTLRERRTF